MPEKYKRNSSNFAAGIQSDEDVLMKLKQLREEYAREGSNDPQFYAQLDDLENHLLSKMNRPSHYQESEAPKFNMNNT